MDFVFDKINTNLEAIQLTKSIREVVIEYKFPHCSFIALHMALKQYYIMFQNVHVTGATHLKAYNNNEDVIQKTGRKIDTHPSLTNYVLCKNKIDLDLETDAMNLNAK